MKKVLVTGTGGFILSNFIRYAIYEKSPYTFISIDKVRKSSVLDNIYFNKNHKFYIGDVSDDHFVNVIFEAERPDIVINGAAESFVDASINNARPFITSNILGTQVLIDASLKWGVEKFMQISTDEVFGHLESENAPSWTENSPLNPRNPYSASKAAAELLVQAAHQTHGLNYVITRSCNNYGPRQDPEKFIPKIIKHILENKKVPVYGAGMQIRDWMYVDDNCSAILKILSDGKNNEIYNISAGQELPNIEVFQRICNEMGGGYDQLEFTTERPGHDFRYSIDSSKLRDLGWTPKYKFNDGIKLTINWFNSNKWFLNK